MGRDSDEDSVKVTHSQGFWMMETECWQALWEYAVRASSTTAYCFGDDEKKLGEYAWYSQNSGSKHHPVVTKKPNAWGIHDGHGSVCEWCSDWYDSKYPKGPLTDPVGPSTGSLRAFRGGCWFDVAAGCWSGFRDGSVPSVRGINLGFRLALSPSGIPKSEK